MAWNLWAFYQFLCAIAGNPTKAFAQLYLGYSISTFNQSSSQFGDMLQRLFPKNAFRIPSFSSDVNEPPLLFKIADQFGIDRNLVACTLCEFFCTFFLLYGGTSVCAVRKVDGQDFEYQVPVGWGLWLIFTLYLGFNISGSHLNPAISFLMYVLGKISFRRFLCYAAAQFSGAFVGAALTFLVYYEAINDFDGGIRQVYGPNRTANIFSTYPKDYLSTAGGVIDQVVTTAILATMVLSITDEKNNIPKPAQPFLLGISLWTVVSFWAQNCGAALNPARDFAPRVFTFVAGYGWEVFSYRNYTWFWIPIICPMVGGVLAGIVYKTFIGDYLIHLPPPSDASLSRRTSADQMTFGNGSCSAPTSPTTITSISAPILDNFSRNGQKPEPIFAA